MDQTMLLGLWRVTLPVPPALWKKTDKGGENPLAFMTEAHHRIRDFAVMELTRSGKPLPPERIGQELQLPQTQVVDILDELERHKTFLFRNAQGAVTWAYPVTVDPTHHRLEYSGGQVYAA